MERSWAKQMSKLDYSSRNTSGSKILMVLDSCLRRSFDITASLLGLIILFPIFLLIAIAIKRDSSGPILFRGRRAGKGGCEFKILKFRTMYEIPDSYKGAKVTAQDDPRITPMGKKLRDTKLNELPQLWNVLIGDMSLVGPRPEDPDIAKTWPKDVQKVLLSVRPGVTSPATVMYRDEESLLSSGNVMEDYLKKVLPTKLRLDMLYVRNRSIFTDLDVIFWTAIALLPSLREMSVPKHLLYWGPLSLLVTRYLSWLFIDSLISFFSMSFAGIIIRSARPLDIGLGRAVMYALVISLIFSFFNWSFGMNKVEWSRAQASEVITLSFSAFLATSVTILLNSNITSLPPLPEATIVLTGIFSLMGFIAVRYRERVITGIASRWINLRGGVKGVGERVLLVGAGQNGALASWLFKRNDIGKPFNVIGTVDDDPRKQGLVIDGHPVLGTTDTIPKLVGKMDIGVIFFTIDNIDEERKAKILSLCKSTKAKIILLPDILEILKQRLQVVVDPCGKVDDTFLIEGNQTKIAGSNNNALSEEQLMGWLNELEELLDTDVALTRKKIKEIRKSLIVMEEEKTYFEERGNL